MMMMARRDISGVSADAGLSRMQHATFLPSLLSREKGDFLALRSLLVVSAATDGRMQCLPPCPSFLGRGRECEEEEEEGLVTDIPRPFN